MIAASDNAGIKETQLPRFLSFLFPPRDVISWSLLSSGLACLLALPNARSCSLSHSSCVIECFFSIALAFTFALCDSFLSGVCSFPFPISLHLVLFFSTYVFPLPLCVLPQSPSLSGFASLSSCFHVFHIPFVFYGYAVRRFESAWPLDWNCWIPDLKSRWNIVCT